MNGLVIRNTGSWYTVYTDDAQLIDCKIKGNFRLKGIRSTNPVAIGDRVEIITNSDGTAFISNIEDRRNYIVRKASNLSKQSHILASNIDCCFLIVTVNYPETATTFIDRFLASAEAYRIPVVLVFNKIDRYNEDDLRYLDGMVNLYTSIGYECMKVVVTGNIAQKLLEVHLQGFELLIEVLYGYAVLIDTKFSGLSYESKEVLYPRDVILRLRLRPYLYGIDRILGD